MLLVLLVHEAPIIIGCWYVPLLQSDIHFLPFEDFVISLGMLPLNAVSKGAAKILAVSGLQIIFFASYSVFGVLFVTFSYVYHFISFFFT